MLQDCRTYAKLPASDIERARRFYAEKLGLTRSREMAPDHHLYECGGSLFMLFPSSGCASGTHDQIGFMVPDVAEAVRQLKARGVVFETYATSGDVWSGEIAENEHRRVAWFKDSEGNLLNVAQRLDGKTM